MAEEWREAAGDIFANSIAIWDFLRPIRDAVAQRSLNAETAGAFGHDVGLKIDALRDCLEKCPTWSDVPDDVQAALMAIGQIVRKAYTDCVAYGDVAQHLAQSDLGPIASRGWQALKLSDPKNVNVLAWVGESTLEPAAATPPGVAGVGESLAELPTKATDAESHIQQIAQAVGDENTAAIMAIAKDEDLSADEKMKEIVKLDSRFIGKDSNKWATLLRVTPQAIRQTNTWKHLHRTDGDEA